MYNPSLRQESRFAPAAVIPKPQELPILDWLEANGRLIARQEGEQGYVEEEEGISDLMGVDDNSFDDLEDDDNDLGEL